MNRPKPHTGGCLCGAVRYRITNIVDTGYCHCTSCRRATGGAVLAWSHVQAADFELTKGEPKNFAVSNRGTRNFCAQCGSTLYFEATDASWYSVTIATFDDPESVEPAVHICTDNSLKWLKIDDELPDFPDSHFPAPEVRH